MARRGLQKVMGAEIKDEFSQLPISRQRKYYLRQRRDRRCTKCGKPVDRGSLCLEHMVQMREYRRKTFGLKRRYHGSFSYLAEAACSAEHASANGNGSNMAQPLPAETTQFAVNAPSQMEGGVPADHPLRSVKARVDHLLEKLSHSFDKLDLRSGISPKSVLKAWVLMNLYSIRSPKLFCEQLGYNLLWLWFLNRSFTQGSFDPVAFEQTYDRVLTTESARQFFTQFFSDHTN